MTDTEINLIQLREAKLELYRRLLALPSQSMTTNEVDLAFLLSQEPVIQERLNSGMARRQDGGREKSGNGT